MENSIGIEPPLNNINRERLPHTFEKSDVIEVLSGVDTIVQPATDIAITESLSGQKVLVRSADHPASGATNLEQVGDFNVVTTVDDPAVIYLYGASFCSLDLILDKRGNAVGIHRSMLPPDKMEQTMKDISGRVDSFLQGGVGVVDEDNVLLVSGTNINSQEREERETLLDIIKNSPLRRDKYPRQKVTTLFVKPEESHSEKMLTGQQQYITRLISVLDSIRDLKSGSGSISNKVRDVEGLIFVPKQLDRGGQNRIFLMDKNTDNAAIKAAMFDFTPSQ